MAAKLTKIEPWAPKKHYDDAYSYVMKNGVSKINEFVDGKLKNSAGEVKVKTTQQSLAELDPENLLLSTRY